MADSYWGRRALDFVDAVQGATRADEVTARFENAIAEVGFHAYIMAGIPAGGRKLEQLTLANGWPAEWFSIYIQENLSEVDPIPRYSVRTVDPFLWSEAPYDREAEPEAQLVMDRAIDFRFQQGFCVPLHYDDSAAAISMAGDKLDLDDRNRGALHLMSVFAHGRLRTLGQRTPRRRLLSQKEAEVVRWAAVGKTIWETSVILRIPERNVKYHLAEAQQKLGTANKTSTVAQAIVTSEITL